MDADRTLDRVSTGSRPVGAQDHRHAIRRDRRRADALPPDQGLHQPGPRRSRRGPRRLEPDLRGMSQRAGCSARTPATSTGCFVGSSSSAAPRGRAGRLGRRGRALGPGGQGLRRARSIRCSAASSRDRVRLYCDTPVHGDTGEAMGEALKRRLGQGFTFLKIDLGVDRLGRIPGALYAPAGLLEAREAVRPEARAPDRRPERAGASGAQPLVRLAQRHAPLHRHPAHREGARRARADFAHARGVVGYAVPLAVDHFGHIGARGRIQFARRLERYTLAWLEDALPWQLLSGQYRRLAVDDDRAAVHGRGHVPERRASRPLLESGGVGIIHPGRPLDRRDPRDEEDRRPGAGPRRRDGRPHGRESPIACMAAVHVCGG